MDYNVLYAYDIPNLMVKVQAQIEMGFKPQGGICAVAAPAAYQPYVMLFYQAMIKKA